MSRRQFANKKDANHKQLVKQIERFGVAVFDLSDIKREGFDTLMSYRGELFPVEIKNPDDLPKKFFTMDRDSQHEYLRANRLTGEELKAYNKLQRTGNKLIITYSADHCLREMGVLTKPFSKS